MLTEWIPSASVVSPPEEPELLPEVAETPPDSSLDWESEVSLLERRDWHAETIIHL